MPIVIPVQPGDVVGSADYRLGTTIESTAYLIDMHWNRREDRWYLSLLEIDETPIVSGVKVVLGVVLGRRSAHPLFRRGALVAVDLERTGPGRGVEAGWADLGRRVVLRWYDAEEFAALAGYS